MTCFCINLLDIGRRYLGFSYEASGAVRAAKSFTRIPKRASDRYSRAGSFGKIERGADHSANITLYAAENGAEKHTAGNLEITLVQESFYMKNKYYPYAARYPFSASGCICAADHKWLGQEKKNRNRALKWAPRTCRAAEKYDMIRTWNWKKRGDAHAGRIQRK